MVWCPHGKRFESGVGRRLLTVYVSEERNDQGLVAGRRD